MAARETLGPCKTWFSDSLFKEIIIITYIHLHSTYSSLSNSNLHMFLLPSYQPFQLVHRVFPAPTELLCLDRLTGCCIAAMSWYSKGNFSKSAGSQSWNALTHTTWMSMNNKWLELNLWINAKTQNPSILLPHASGKEKPTLHVS